MQKWSIIRERILNKFSRVISKEFRKYQMKAQRVQWDAVGMMKIKYR